MPIKESSLNAEEPTVLIPEVRKPNLGPDDIPILVLKLPGIIRESTPVAALAHLDAKLGDCYRVVKTTANPLVERYAKYDRVIPDAWIISVDFERVSGTELDVIHDGQEARTTES